MRARSSGRHSEEFAAHGYTATRLEDVARRAGIAKGLPHFYFSSKEELFKAVLRRLVLPDWSILEAELERSGAPTSELLRGLMTVAYERLVKNARAHQLLRLLIAEGPKFPNWPNSTTPS
ncbi:MAG TPA: helix-turn-helix domain-containing protein [Stellaceae bacterium]